MSTDLQACNKTLSHLRQSFVGRLTARAAGHSTGSEIRRLRMRWCGGNRGSKKRPPSQDGGPVRFFGLICADFEAGAFFGAADVELAIGQGWGVPAFAIDRFETRQFLKSLGIGFQQDHLAVIAQHD